MHGGVAKTSCYQKVVRAKIVSMAADGILNQDIAKASCVSRPTVQLWRKRFLTLCLTGLEKVAPTAGLKAESVSKKDLSGGRSYIAYYTIMRGPILDGEEVITFDK
jgi:hypothetical protein